MAKKAKNNLIPRAPVVVVLGHVDHGKTTLLDFIKKSHVADKESGGITQHIGAYEIEHNGKRITFIDTPGHEAFSAMRSRGAKVADIAVLVIAADENVKPQTKEAISHIKKAEIPMIVALNKTDKPEAEPERIKRELIKEDILVESMAGKIPSVEVSAKTGKGVNDLLEMILLLAEMENFQSDVSKSPSGIIIESRLDASRGATTTAILQAGVLKKGDIVGTVSAVGKIKILENFKGEPVDEVLPSMPVIILGFENVPGVGEEFKVFPDIEEAKKNIKPLVLEKPADVPAVEGQRTLNLILKTDVLGSLEAVKEVLKSIPQEKTVTKILKAEVGEINESDVKLARTSRATIVGFRVKVNPSAKNFADREKIRIKTFEIIYELAQSIRGVLEKMTAPEIVRVDLGKARVLAIFKQEKTRQILGAKVTDGQIKKGAAVEVLRGEEKIGKGKIVGLQRAKKEIGEVAKGFECGILYEGSVKAEVKDILLAYSEERRKIEL